MTCTRTFLRHVFLLCLLPPLRTEARKLKILAYSPSLGHSHLHFIGALADILVDAGHTVHVIIPEWDPDLLTNGTAKAQRIIRLPPSVPSMYPEISFKSDPFSKTNKEQSWKELEIFLNITLQFCEEFLSNKDLINDLRAEEYDFGFSEFMDYCPRGIFEVLGVKSTAIVSATPMSDFFAEAWGLPSPSSYVTDAFYSFIGAPTLTYGERISNFAYTCFGRLYGYPKFLTAQNNLFRRLVRTDFPDLRFLAQKAAIAFINTHQLLDIPRPISNKIVYIGGIAMKQRTKLDKEFEGIIEKSKNGVVVFSLGSVADTKKMPTEMKRSFLNAFSQFPEYTFLMKIDVHPHEEKLFANFSNVLTFQWIDQINLLNHPSTKAFISHVGLNSLMEAAFAGVPMIYFPLFADQEYNTAVALKKNAGVYINKNKFTAEILIDALKEVLYNPSYRASAKRLQEKLKKFPFTPKEMFLKWTNYIAEFHELSEFDLYGANISYAKYFMIDFLVPFVIFTVFFAIILLRGITSCMWRRLHWRKTKLE